MSEWVKAQASGHNGCVEVRQAEAGVQVCRDCQQSKACQSEMAKRAARS